LGFTGVYWGGSIEMINISWYFLLLPKMFPEYPWYWELCNVCFHLLLYLIWPNVAKKKEVKINYLIPKSKIIDKIKRN
jgi:hypothetical protein